MRRCPRCHDRHVLLDEQGGIVGRCCACRHSAEQEESYERVPDSDDDGPRDMGECDDNGGGAGVPVATTEEVDAEREDSDDTQEQPQPSPDSGEWTTDRDGYLYIGIERFYVGSCYATNAIAKAHNADLRRVREEQKALRISDLEVYGRRTNELTAAANEAKKGRYDAERERDALQSKCDSMATELKVLRGREDTYRHQHFAKWFSGEWRRIQTLENKLIDMKRERDALAQDLRDASETYNAQIEEIDGLREEVEQFRNGNSQLAIETHNLRGELERLRALQLEKVSSLGDSPLPDTASSEGVGDLWWEHGHSGVDFGIYRADDAVAVAASLSEAVRCVELINKDIQEAVTRTEQRMQGRVEDLEARLRVLDDKSLALGCSTCKGQRYIFQLREPVEGEVLTFSDKLDCPDCSHLFEKGDQTALKMSEQRVDDLCKRIAELERLLAKSCGCGWIDDKTHIECQEHAKQSERIAQLERERDELRAKVDLLTSQMADAASSAYDAGRDSGVRATPATASSEGVEDLITRWRTYSPRIADDIKEAVRRTRVACQAGYPDELQRMQGRVDELCKRNAELERDRDGWRRAMLDGKAARERDALREEVERLKSMQMQRFPAGEVELRQRIAELEEWKEEILEDRRKILADEGADDEKHCNCVVHLRRRIAELEREAAGSDLTSYEGMTAAEKEAYCLGKNEGRAEQAERTGATQAAPKVTREQVEAMVRDWYIFDDHPLFLQRVIDICELFGLEGERCRFPQETVPREK